MCIIFMAVMLSIDSGNWVMLCVLAFKTAQLHDTLKCNESVDNPRFTQQFVVGFAIIWRIDIVIPFDGVRKSIVCKWVARERKSGRAYVERRGRLCAAVLGHVFEYHDAGSWVWFWVQRRRVSLRQWKVSRVRKVSYLCANMIIIITSTIEKWVWMTYFMYLGECFTFNFEGFWEINSFFFIEKLFLLYTEYNPLCWHEIGCMFKRLHV